jgi:CheY-like chemotaxis protein
MAKILVVDDNPTARQFAGACLKALDHQVTLLAPDCLYQVLTQLHQDPPDLLILDLIMPGCPGLTVLRFCREDPHLKNLKVIVMTSHGDATAGRVLQAMGRVHYLPKPVAPPALAVCVERFLNDTLVLDPGWDLACRGVVAVVDDSRLTRSFHCTCMRKLGFRAVEVEPTDLAGTRQALAELHPDLILLDYLMPAFNGEQVLRSLRATESLLHTPVLMVTAHQGMYLENRMMGLDLVEVLVKPVSIGDLTRAVEAVFVRPALDGL